MVMRFAAGFLGVSVLAMGAALAQQSAWPAGPDLALSTDPMTDLAQLPASGSGAGGGVGATQGADGQVPPQGPALTSPAMTDNADLLDLDDGPMHLMPDGGRQIVSDINGRLIAEDGYVAGQGFVRVPVLQRERDYLMLQGEGTVSLDDGDGDDFYVLSAGLIYRRALTEQTAMGVNAFIEGGETEGENFGQVTLGWEAETVWPEPGGEASSLMVGGNFYLPFEDYTDDFLFRAPRLGADLFTSAGWQWDDSRVDAVLTGYYYADTMDAQSYYGGAGDLEYRYFPDWMPQGSHLFASAGVNYDSLDEEAELRGRVGLTIGLDGLGQEDGGDRFDRVADVRRNLATGSALVPIEPVASWSSMGGGNFDAGCGIDSGGNTQAGPGLYSVELRNSTVQPGVEFPLLAGQLLGDLILDQVINNACSAGVGGTVYADCVAAFTTFALPEDIAFSGERSVAWVVTQDTPGDTASCSAEGPQLSGGGG